MIGKIAIYDCGYYGVGVTLDFDEALRVMFGEACSMRVIVHDTKKGLVYFATLRAKNGHFVYLRLPRSVYPFYQHREKALLFITFVGDEK